MEPMYAGWRWREPSRHEASQLLGFLNEGGIPPGEFVTKLIGVIFKADRENKGRLALGFPGYCSAVWCYQNDDDWERRLHTIAGTTPRGGW